ncbi:MULTISPECIES: hypothetical protein [unclassified Streptomyces]|uniref:hypothetical protein n=1 Tax=unclassified Streptomyces TaxID=2593676 RepID=UPI00081EBE5C|nr:MULTISPECIES: hypothetical protein [unclassified Streptomyces]MYZ37510.1 hypothetical protein [Streptomyces sp. SID4917]SCF91867.1 hypothetical protein GA0115259_1048216 [Streptomyces sp. MnatMP-M17]
MPADLTPSTTPGLSVRLRSDWFKAIFRADLIRHHTLIALVQHWGDADAREDVINQLDALAEAVASPREGELDALTEAVEDAAAMDSAEIEIRLADALRLRDELDAVISKLTRFNPQRLTAVATRPERRTA